ncbi:MAG TPA: DNA repair protein RadC [Candidatus Acetothermia bacterium]|nr:DNA repair protein RadC [Candidatus Acetothermia bacterium]
MLRARFQRGKKLDCSADAKDYVILTLGDRDHEAFACLFLDTRHRVIRCDLMATGSLAEAQVYPREVVKRALLYNAAAVIFAHNHPSGVAEPSKGDKALTDRLASALQLIDVQVLDHLVVGGDETVSFADRGML